VCGVEYGFYGSTFMMSITDEMELCIDGSPGARLHDSRLTTTVGLYYN